jgi:hypothetical protein
MLLSHSRWVVLWNSVQLTVRDLGVFIDFAMCFLRLLRTDRPRELECTHVVATVCSIGP